MAYNRLVKIKVRTSSLFLESPRSGRFPFCIPQIFILFPCPYRLKNNVKYGWNQLDCRRHRHKILVLILSQVNERTSNAYYLQCSPLLPKPGPSVRKANLVPTPRAASRFIIMPSGNQPCGPVECPRHETSSALQVLHFVELVLSQSQKPNTRSSLLTDSVHGIIDFTFTQNLPKANRTVCNLHTQPEAT